MERIPPNEPADIVAMIAASRELMEQNRCPVRRGQHPKHHGLAWAEFVVSADIPAELRHGVFTNPGSRFQAWVRLSNGTRDDDRKADVHGMAVKLVGVPGAKLLPAEEDAETQDFVFMDSPQFFESDVLAVRRLTQAVVAANGPSAFKRMLVGLPAPVRRQLHLLVFHFLLGGRFGEFRRVQKATSQRPDDPLSITYWSATPYLLGDALVKYKAVPTTTVPLPLSDYEGRSPHRLQAAMQARLLAGPVRYELFVQTWVGPAETRTNVVENATTEWSEAAHRPVKVAELVFPAQTCFSHERVVLAEHLAFTPWHGLPAHRPVGGINRARRDVYAMSAALRHERNGVPPGEPTAAAPPPPAPVGLVPEPFDAGNLMYGWRNSLERYALTHAGWFWRACNKVRRLERLVNRVLINRAVSKCPARPHRLCMQSDYVSWDSLTDRTYTGRHLDPANSGWVAALPPIPQVLKLFERPPGVAHLSNKSTVLFAHFAQWFTDGFLRTARLPNGDPDWQRNTSNHEIDLSPVYGRTRAIAAALRRNDGSGKLRSQIVPAGPGRVGGEYPPYYFDQAKFDGPRDIDGLPFVDPAFDPVKKELFLLSAEKALLAHAPERLRTRFALGVERANSQIGYVMLNTLFLREHNRLCDVLKAKHPGWDDDRLYQTARNTVIVMVIKLVVEEYINHISPFHFQFRAQPASFYASRWNRTNWISLEFNLLYRWHGLVPDSLWVGRQCVPMQDTLFNNGLLMNTGLAAAFDAASHQPAGRVGLKNTHPYLVKEVEAPSLQLGRDAKLQGYNAYRQYAGYKPVERFEQITSDPSLQRELRALYGHPNNVELYVGLFAEDIQPGSAVPPLAGRLVAVDAFSQALTNPLLSEQVYRPDTFAEGWAALQQTHSLGDVLRRNIAAEPLTDPLVTMTQR